MKEEFLHYLWKYGLFDRQELVDNDGNQIVVISPGDCNHDAGPDFFNARLSIAGTEWAGNVEIHLKSSHFESHGHNLDPAYDNIILHIVHEDDKAVFNSKGEEILTVRLIFNPQLYEKYVKLLNNPFLIACQEEITDIDRFFLLNWLNSVTIERMQRRTDHIVNIFNRTGNDWEETFYRILSRYFGFRVNTEPFEMLASAIPFRIIRKHTDNRFQIEALLFGTAGLLDEGLFREAINDLYYTGLVKEYKILSAKYSLHPLHGWIWKFARLRPANFPTVRISQLAAMLAVAGGLFSTIIEASDIKQLRKLFEVSASAYWDDHYVFGKKSRKHIKVTGSQATDILLINAVIPVIFVYGIYRDDRLLYERALSFLEEIDPEDNTVVNEWEAAGIECDSAFITQALIHLRNNYCKKRRCLECRIGALLISQGKTLRKPDELMFEPRPAITWLSSGSHNPIQE